MAGKDPDGPASPPSYRELRAVTRRHLHAIWNAAKAGEALDGEDGVYAELILEHPEFHNVWEFADEVGGDDYLVDGVNPFVHLSFHAIVENQIAQRDPPEVAETLDRLLVRGMSRHEALHAIMAKFIEVAFPAFQGREPFNTTRYTKRLRCLGRA